MKMPSTKTVKNWDEEAKILASREQWNDAARTLKRAAQKAPHEAGRWKQIAEWQARGGDLKAAIRTLENAIELNQHAAQATRIELWLALAEANLSAQNWDLGARACGEILRLEPRHHAALELLATAYLQTNELESAVEVMGQLLAISPRDPLHRLKLATLLQLQGKLGEASLEFQRVLELYPAMPFAEDAAEAVEALDRLQTQQILMMAAEQNAFRLNLERHFDSALAEGGFYLSDSGRESLRHMVSDVNFETTSTPPRFH
jgi:tetratricopeptide (TPR) repeat protein